MSSSGYPSSWNSSSLGVGDFDKVHTLTWYIIVGIIYGIIILVTIVGNLLVIIAFKRDRRIHDKVANWYIVNLSVADLAVGFVSLPFNFIWMMDPEESWPFGEIPCKMYLLIDYIVTNVPVVTIIFISLDRYWLLTKKLEYHRYATKKKATAFITFMWIFCVAFFGVLTFAWIPLTGFEPEIEYDWNCELEATYNFECQVFMIVLFFFCPLLAIACLNFVVYRNIRERSKGFVQSKPVASETKRELEPPKADNDIGKEQHLNDSSGSNTALANGTSSISMISLSIQNSNTKGNATKIVKPVTDKKKNEYNRHRKAAVTLAVLVGVFIVCWLPFYITSLLGTLCEGCVTYLAWEVTNNLLWCNSTINPFLYAAMNLQFRHNFVRLLGLDKCILKRRREPITSVTDE